MQPYITPISPYISCFKVPLINQSHWQESLSLRLRRTASVGFSSWCLLAWAPEAHPIGDILGLCRDNGIQNGNYRDYSDYEHRGYIGIIGYIHAGILNKLLLVLLQFYYDYYYEYNYFYDHYY